MQQIITPARRLDGQIRLPGDKSVSHRYGILAAIAEGSSTIHHYSTGADCQSTLGCMRALGVSITRREDGAVLIEGRGLNGLQAPAGDLDAGNSGSTIRMLSGVLAAQPFTSRIAGDESLSRRPMDRIMKPLSLMGADVEAVDGRFPPLTIHGRALKAMRYEPPMASAQVKTCVLMAGLYAEGETAVLEKVGTRDHTELALREFGAEIVSSGGVITVKGPARLQGRELSVPGDLSSAAFFLVAAAIVPGSKLLIQGVGLNPSRSALLDWLVAAGVNLRVSNLAEVSGELVGDLLVTGGDVKGGIIRGAASAALIDEIPVLSVLGAVSRDGLVVKDARELRVKETDRIATVADNLQRMGVRVEVYEDGFRVPGKQKFRAARVDSFGDHRIAMAFAVAGLAAEGETAVLNAGAASVSFPEFYATLRQITV
ncbi:MAG: 3-phosphoshikimate 1-carboxyvinyltransferase [Bryobacterales bacterium]|nr:3-phosphoshikimate 1-carboxyvinyltransferase [Bryobacterales bacterium]